MDQNKLIKLVIYGYSEDYMSIELSKYTEPVERTKIANEILANILSYMKSNLGLNENHIYIYVEKEFKLLKNYSFRHLGQVDDKIPIIIVFTDINLKEHTAAQRKIFRDLGINEQIDSELMLYSQITEHPQKLLSTRSLTKNKLVGIENKSEFHLTEGVAIKPLESGPNQYVYSTRVLTAPFSNARYFIRLKDKLLPPIYLDADYIKENYNYAPHLQYPREFKAFEINEKGELILTDKKIIESARGVMKEIIGKASIMLLKGQGLVRLSLPVRMFDSRSQVEKFGDFFNSLDYIHRAFDAPNQLERLKFIISMFASNFYYGIGAKKPFNPFLGETFEGYYPEGTKVYVEHINHDPPIDAILLVNDEKKFRIYGKFETRPKLKTNEITIAFKGVLTVEMKGEKIFAEMAHLVNSGLIYGERKLKLKDAFYFYYPDAGLKAYIKIGPGPKDKKHDNLTGGIYNQKDLINFDFKSLGEYIFESLDAKKLPTNTLSSITGSWLSNILFDDKEYWNQKQSCFKLQVKNDTLPSDWRFREDLLWMLYDDFKMADAWKLKLEEMQRADRKNRDAIAKAFKKSR